MSDYKVFNDNVEERTWEELYQDNVMLQQENQKYKEIIDKAINYIEKESAFLSDDEYELFNKKELKDILKESGE